MANEKNWYDYLAYILLIVGGLNWLLVGLFDANLVSIIFGQTILATIVYVLVGISAVYALVKLFQK